MTRRIVSTTLDVRKPGTLAVPARPLHIGPVPGANGCTPPDRPFEYAGLTWDATDSLVEGGAPIGLSLAMEMRGATT